jgi:hypothetical protein
MTKAKRREFRTDFQAKSKLVKILTLKKGQGTSMFLMVAAMPPERVGMFPSVFTSFHTKTLAAHKDGRARLLYDKVKWVMEEPDIARALGVAGRFPVSATVEVKGNSVYIRVEGDKIYYWVINVQATVYPPDEMKNLGHSFEARR